MGRVAAALGLLRTGAPAWTNSWDHQFCCGVVVEQHQTV